MLFNLKAMRNSRLRWFRSKCFTKSVLPDQENRPRFGVGARSSASVTDRIE